MSLRKNQDAFGRNAEQYAVSKVHAQGVSLQRLVALVQPVENWAVLDVATGAGHTAFVFAPHVRSVYATDITREMLDVTERDAATRSLGNVIVASAEAERLPFADAVFDLVTCRIAPHHFSAPGEFVREAARVLRPGGVCAVVDNIVPPGTAGAYVNAFEMLRDPSHGRCLTANEWRALFAEAGLALRAEERYRKKIDFGFWASRHTQAVRSYLLSMLDAASGEAKRFLSPEQRGEDRFFYLEEGLFVAEQPEVEA